MKYYGLLIFVLILFLLSLVGCKKAETDNGNDETTIKEGFDSITISDDFNFSSTKKQGVEITVNNHLGLPQSNALVQIFTASEVSSFNPTDDHSIEIPTHLILAGRTDYQGIFSTNLTIATHIEELTVIVGVMGIPNSKTVALVDNSLTRITFEK